MSYIKILCVACCFFNLTYAQPWAQLPDFPGLQRDDGVACVVNNKAYVGTGNNGFALEKDFYCFDLSTYSWTPIASMPSGAERQYASVFTYSNYFYVIGGIDASNVPVAGNYRYDISTNTWSLVAQVPGAYLWGSVSFTVGSKAYLVGGNDYYGLSSQKVWEYDMVTNTWTPKTNFPFGPRWRGSAAVLNNVPYMIFGIDNSGSGAFRKEIYKYDQFNDIWTKVGTFPQSGRIYAAMQPITNKLAIFGGRDSLNNFYNDCWYFDETNGFVQGPSLPSLARKGGMSFSSGNKFYYTCGVNGSTRLKETWMLDGALGLQETDAAAPVSIAPNPCHDELYFTSPGKLNLQVAIFDATGKQIMFSEPHQLKLDVGTLSPGMYFLKYKNDQISGVKKVIKE